MRVVPMPHVIYRDAPRFETGAAFATLAVAEPVRPCERTGFSFARTDIHARSAAVGKHMMEYMLSAIRAEEAETARADFTLY